MSYLSEKKLAVFGSAGAIGSNVVQTALSLGLTPDIAMYDPFEKGNEGAAEEIYHCAFPGARVTWTSDAGEAMSGASYLISSGGAPRKEGMTREDLLKGNAEIAAQLGRTIKEHAPDLELGVIIFNPADITGLVTLVHSGLAPSRISTLAALDSTRLQTALAQRLVDLAVKRADAGDFKFYNMILERMDGKVPDKLISAQVPTQKRIVLIDDAHPEYPVKVEVIEAEVYELPDGGGAKD